MTALTASKHHLNDKMMKQQGIGIIVATPHFYMHREASLDSYLVKRQNAYEKLMASDPAVKDIHIGAEVAIEKGISVLGELEKLCISGTRLILLEPPFTQYNSWIVEEIDEIANSRRLIPIIAHVHRYMGVYSKSDLKSLMSVDAVFQINAEAFEHFPQDVLLISLFQVAEILSLEAMLIILMIENLILIL